MADFLGIKALLNTTEGMTTTYDGNADEGNWSLTGPSWFRFDNRSVDTIYYNANSWVGFGANTIHLQVSNRDGRIYKMRWQEGTLWNERLKFFKLRFEGLSVYNDDNNKLIWELFLLDDETMFLNIIKYPSVNGTYRLTCNGTSIEYVPSADSLTFEFKAGNTDMGRQWSVEATDIFVEPPYDYRFLITDSAKNIYTVVDNQRQQVGTGDLTSTIFKEHGVKALNGINFGEFMLGLNHPKLCYWQDSMGPIPTFNLSVKAVPLVPQLVVMQTIKVTKTVQCVTIYSDDVTKFNVSFDEGKTWYNIVDNAWTQVTEVNDGNTRRELEVLLSDKWMEKVHGSLKFRYYIYKDGFFGNIRVDY